MAKKKETEAAALVSVRVIAGTLYDAGTHFKAGEILEVTPERAEALGDLVEAVTE